jgi:hypothetical protein
MVKINETIESEIILNGNEDWENQLIQLKQSFNDFYLISFVKNYRQDIGVSYNVFKFTHTVEIIID